MKKKSLSVKKRILNKTNFFLDQKFINKIYQIFAKNIKGVKKSLIAVSGGPDSLSLAFLAKCYSINNSAKFSYAVVDHRLRKESSNEANKVVRILKKIGIDCKILVWKGKKPNSNIQKIARNYRYHLLTKECKRLKVETIILGHQLNDLHENFFLRMTRGSGLKGLTSLGKKTEISNIALLRPMIDIPKKDLEKLAYKIFGDFIKDPSNKNEDFKRVRVRKILDVFQKEGLETNKLALTINNLKSANSALDFYAKTNISKNTTFLKKTNSYLINKNFFLKPEEVILRSMNVILKDLSNRYYPPRGKKMSRLIYLMSSQNKPYKTTLGGCVFEKINETVIITKE